MIKSLSIGLIVVVIVILVMICMSQHASVLGELDGILATRQKAHSNIGAAIAIDGRSIVADSVSDDAAIRTAGGKIVRNASECYAAIDFSPPLSNYCGGLSDVGEAGRGPFRVSYLLRRSSLSASQVWNDLTAKCIDGRGMARIDKSVIEASIFQAHLKFVGLGNTCNTDAAVAALSVCDELEFLDLSGSCVRSDSLRHLKALKHLRFIDLSNTLIDDEGLKYVEDIENIECVRVYCDYVTEQGLQALHATRPHVATISRFSRFPVAAEYVHVDDLARVAIARELADSK